MRNFLARALVVGMALGSTACTEELPTDVGDALLPGGGVLTFEVILPASAFLVRDSSFSGYTEPAEAPFSLVARGFENVVDANTLLRFSLPPTFLSVRTSETTVVVDSTPSYGGGRMVLKMDTLGPTPLPIKFALYHTAEEWDVSATWTLRSDSIGARLPWTTAGGTRGPQVDTVTWTSGDSIVFDVDSATIALWADSTNDERGALIVSETDGSRARILSTTVRVDARSELRADTVLTVNLVPAVRTYITNPILASPFSGIRVGGIPAWRAFLQFRDDFGDLVIPCNNGQASCSVRLDSVHINRAQLLLKPAITPAGFVPEDSIYIEARPILTGPTVPLERSPLGTFANIVRTDLMAPRLFRAPTATDVVRVDVTSFINHLFDETVTEGNRLPGILALLQFVENGTAGFATFEEGPMLRLVLTTTTEGR